MTRTNELRQLVDRLESVELGGEVLLTIDPAYDPHDFACLMGTPPAMLELATRLLRAVADRSSEVDVDDLFPSGSPRIDFVGLTEEFADLPESSWPEGGWRDRLACLVAILVLMSCGSIFVLGLKTAFAGLAGLLG